MPVSKDSLTVSLSGYELAPGYGAVPPTPTYSNVTITSTGATTNPIYTTGTGGGNPWVTNTTLKGGQLELEGKDADVIIDGKSLLKTLQTLEERLNILVPNQELEKEWNELRDLGEKYRKLEQDLVEKTHMWKVLQKTS